MGTMMNKGTPGQQSLMKRMLPFGIATAVVLLVPAVSMLFTEEVNWGPGDFVVAAGLLLLTSLAYVMAARISKTKRQRVIAGAGLALVLITIWTELAVGIFH